MEVDHSTKVSYENLHSLASSPYDNMNLLADFFGDDPVCINIFGEEFFC